MKKNLVLTAALVVGMMLAGCSKSESENMETETGKTLREQIVGVWRSGDYFVSFSEDGYNSAYFPIDGEDRIDEGSYTIDGDTVLVKGSFYRNTTKYVVNSVTDTEISLTMTYRFKNMTLNPLDKTPDGIATLTLRKSADTPSVRINGLDGKTFSIEETYADGDGVNYGYTQRNTIHSNEKYQYIDYTFDFHESEPDDFTLRRRFKFYVLLGQSLYSVTLSKFDDGGLANATFNAYPRGLKVDIGELFIDDGGNVEYMKKQ